MVPNDSKSQILGDSTVRNRGTVLSVNDIHSIRRESDASLRNRKTSKFQQRLTTIRSNKTMKQNVAANHVEQGNSRSRQSSIATKNGSTRNTLLRIPSSRLQKSNANPSNLVESHELIHDYDSKDNDGNSTPSSSSNRQVNRMDNSNRRSSIATKALYANHPYLGLSDHFQISPVEDFRRRKMMNASRMKNIIIQETEKNVESSFLSRFLCGLKIVEMHHVFRFFRRQRRKLRCKRLSRCCFSWWKVILGQEEDEEEDEDEEEEEDNSDDSDNSDDCENEINENNKRIPCWKLKEDFSDVFFGGDAHYFFK